MKSLIVGEIFFAEKDSILSHEMVEEKFRQIFNACLAANNINAYNIIDNDGHCTISATMTFVNGPNPEKKGTQYYQHPTGEPRSIKNRMEFAMKVACPTCKETVGRPCLSMKHNSGAAGYEIRVIKYPHGTRFKEALAQQKEAELDFP